MHWFQRVILLIFIDSMATWAGGEIRFWRCAAASYCLSVHLARGGQCLARCSHHRGGGIPMELDGKYLQTQSPYLGSPIWIIGIFVELCWIRLSIAPTGALYVNLHQSALAFALDPKAQEHNRHSGSQHSITAINQKQLAQLTQLLMLWLAFCFKVDFDILRMIL